MRLLSFLFLALLITFTSYAQLDMRGIMSAALDGNMQSVLRLIETSPNKKLLVKDSTIKARFEGRFKFDKDKSDYLSSRKSSIDELLVIYHDYWRASLLDNNKKLDEDLKGKVIQYLSHNYKSAQKLKADLTDEELDKYLSKYIESLGLHTTGYGNTGMFKDLLVWRTEKDTTYKFEINGEKISARVILMDNFVTLGWEEYATLDKLYPGGWATKEALYCVTKGYDLKSENFLISYLAHEGRHFSDYKSFPKLTSTDLEYRAKLTELSMAKETLFSIIEFFVINANYNSENDHQIANYCAIRDLSKILFKTSFEIDMTKWKQLDINVIHSAAKQVLDQNTADLKKVGKDVSKFIKSE